ncbi:YkgB family protein [Haoranjiania flava]|uniref:YkgB family protein n=1 Tax=Haoranjiania flava TaxID=1856322 RepID=A0AAE3LKC3_9BACT|nr:YkgB family protein [Haoranjiania flava]MCU7694259.1 YkgB family protein [Haoranjiania flava]
MKLLKILAGSRRGYMHFMRIAIFVVMAWIGGLKVFQYEADGIVPFVTNSPFMNFFYNKDTRLPVDNGTGKQVAQYTLHKNPEGKVVPENIAWHKHNRTYPFSYGLGAVIVLIGLLVLSGIFSPKTGMIGGLLTSGMSIITLSFLITTPETWVPDLGGAQHGFPYLSAAGRLVIKDIIMMAGGLLIASDAAKTILKKKQEVISA